MVESNLMESSSGHNRPNRAASSRSGPPAAAIAADGVFTPNGVVSINGSADACTAASTALDVEAGDAVNGVPSSSSSGYTSCSAKPVASSRQIGREQV